MQLPQREESEACRDRLPVPLGPQFHSCRQRALPRQVLSTCAIWYISASGGLHEACLCCYSQRAYMRKIGEDYSKEQIVEWKLLIFYQLPSTGSSLAIAHR